MKKSVISIGLALAMIVPAALRANVTSVTLTPGAPTTLTNGRSYYCAGRTYTFRVQATDPAATSKEYWNQILVEIRTGQVVPTVRQSFIITIADIGPGWGALDGVEGVSITDNSPASFTTIDYTIEVRFLWGCTAFAAGANSVRAEASEDTLPVSSDDDVKNFNFGVISQIQVLNFVQAGDAADGIVNPWHDDFDVTGRIVYYSAGEVIVTVVPAAHMTATDLWLVKTAPVVASYNTGEADLDAGDLLRFNIDAEYFYTGPGGSNPIPSAAPLGAYRWEVRVTMAAGGGVLEMPVNTLNITCNRIEVTAVTFENGGGANAPYYHRSIGRSGTLVRVTARREYGGAAIPGVTTFVIRDNAAGGSNTYTLNIGNGATTAAILIDPLPDAADVSAGQTLPITYTVDMIYGGACDGGGGATGQNTSARIVQPAATAANRTCYWDNTDSPGANGALFTGGVTVDPSADGFRISWTALTAGPAPLPDADFDSYRIYYDDGVTTFMVDRNAAGMATLGNIATSFGDIIGMEPLHNYTWWLSAVDVFGNEVALADRPTGTFTTQAFSASASISDGISVYNNNHFNANLDPVSRMVRDTAIKITVRIVTAGTAPDRVSVIIANNDSDAVGPQYGITGVNDDITTLTNGMDRWEIPCRKVSGNTYEGFIPSDHPLMVTGTNIRFVVMTVEGGNPPNYYDRIKEPGPPGDHTTEEWRFRVEKKALFIPWPTRVLNNVMTAQMPCCYPAYFITVDSLVTIKVFDVKGRVIATLSDRVYRPGGQNIKDLGWCGYNKDNRRVGPGLYYIEIKAVTIGNKTVIDKMLKVVVAH